MNPILRTRVTPALATLALALSICGHAAAQSVPTPAPKASAVTTGGPTAPVPTPGSPSSPGPVPTHPTDSTGGPPTPAPGTVIGPGFAPNSPFPGGSTPLTPPTITLPKYLEGVITLEQLRAFMKFQQEVNEQPEIKELLAKLAAQTQQVRLMQSELSKARAKALTDNAEMKAIADKMQGAMRARTSMPFAPAPGTAGSPMPMAPAPSSSLPSPAQGPVPAPAKP